LILFKNWSVSIPIDNKVLGGMLGNGSRFSHFLGNIDHIQAGAARRIAFLFGLTSK
jgi:hypothetical protein